MNNSVVASAPGKLIVMGEHAVVYGKPAIALAIDKRLRCTVKCSDELTFCGKPMNLDKQPYIKYLMRWMPQNVDIRTDSEIPPGSGLGSSAALSVAMLAAFAKINNEDPDKEKIAIDAFGAEYHVQGRASPLDTSTSTHGGGLVLNGPKTNRTLWSVEKDARKWEVSNIDVPKMTFVIGYTGIHAATGPLVEKVRKYKERNSFASDIINEIGDLTLQGIDAIVRNDTELLGRLMTQDHKLLSILGVSCNELNKLVNASLPYSYGAKLTGSGGGGSMIAVTDRPNDVCKAIELHGGVSFVVRTNEPGVKIE